ncbi:MAG TPA: YciI family protein [Anaerolineales bacterium]|nr:YciI family protein [Anaerolineales bacterium]
MQYIMLIYGNEQADAAMSKAEQDAWMGEWFAYTEELRKAGISSAGDPLHPTSTATTVRSKDGKIVTTHGPFAETKEQLGGYYVLNCKDLDEAIAWASKCPGARTGSLELRPIVDFSQMG